MLEVAQKYLQLKSGEYYKCFGKVDKVVGLTIESIGPKAKLNDLCMIFLDKERRDYVMSEVVGFKDSHIILMPFDNVEGVGVGCIVENTGHPLTVAVGDELLGHTVDGIGRVTDCDEKDLKLDSEYPIEAPPPDPMSREIISDVLPLGVKAVDGLITVGKGQRIGIFAGSGVGKSTLLGWNLLRPATKLCWLQPRSLPQSPIHIHCLKHCIRDLISIRQKYAYALYPTGLRQKRMAV